MIAFRLTLSLTTFFGAIWFLSCCLEGNKAEAVKILPLDPVSKKKLLLSGQKPMGVYYVVPFKKSWTDVNAWGRRRRRRDVGEVDWPIYAGPMYKKEKWTSLNSWGKRSPSSRQPGDEGYMLFLDIPVDKLYPKRGWSNLDSWGKKRLTGGQKLEYLVDGEGGSSIAQRRPDDWREFHSWGRKREE